jgi:hypothetical protein
MEYALETTMKTKYARYCKNIFVFMPAENISFVQLSMGQRKKYRNLILFY